VPELFKPVTFTSSSKISYFIHFPGPGASVFISLKRLEFPILLQPELGCFAKKYDPDRLKSAMVAYCPGPSGYLRYLLHFDCEIKGLQIYL
jgi:hypothetical protein